MRFSRNEAYIGGAGNRLSVNLRDLLERRGLTIAALAERSGIDADVVRALIRGEIARPSLSTLDPLAAALEIDVAELLAAPHRNSDERASRRDPRRTFDRRTNPIVADVVAAHPQLFVGWQPADYDDLYSRFGTGGELTFGGAIVCAKAINRRRAALAKAALLLETAHADALAENIDRLYGEVVVAEATMDSSFQRLAPNA